MNDRQKTALANPCLFAFECCRPRFFSQAREEWASVALTVNTGWE